MHVCMYFISPLSSHPNTAIPRMILQIIMLAEFVLYAQSLDCLGRHWNEGGKVDNNLHLASQRNRMEAEEAVLRVGESLIRPTTRKHAVCSISKSLAHWPQMLTSLASSPQAVFICK